jgi:hypothetical protein
MTVRQAVSQSGFHLVQFFAHAVNAAALLTGPERDGHVHLRDGLHGGQRTTQLRFFALDAARNVARSESSGRGRQRLVQEQAQFDASTDALRAWHHVAQPEQRGAELHIACLIFL